MRYSGSHRPPGGDEVSEACAAHARLGPASLVLYDVSALNFEAPDVTVVADTVFAALAVSR